ncbi:MAG: HAD hydrolase-like protein [Planctomycetota bacterium]
MPDLLHGIVFDLDGTLTAPGAIDFDRIHERLGMPDEDSIVEWIERNAASPEERARMFEIVEEEEDRALERMALGDGFELLAEAIERRGPTLRTAICTRNNVNALVAFDALLRSRGFPPSRTLFHVQLARGHRSRFLGRSILEKPSHEPVHEIIRDWGLANRYEPTVRHEHDRPVHEEVIFVGDHIDDCRSGRRAGIRAGLVLHGAAAAPDEATVRAVDAVFADLEEVAELVSARPTRISRQP